MLVKNDVGVPMASLKPSLNRRLKLKFANWECVGPDLTPKTDCVKTMFNFSSSSSTL
jgi:hypothetical protein